MSVSIYSGRQLRIITEQLNILRTALPERALSRKYSSLELITVPFSDHFFVEVRT